MSIQKNDAGRDQDRRTTASFDDLYEESFDPKDRTNWYEDETPVFQEEDPGAFSMSENSFSGSFDMDLNDDIQANPFASSKKTEKTTSVTNPASSSKKRSRTGIFEKTAEPPEQEPVSRSRGYRKMEEDRFFMEEPREEEEQEPRISRQSNVIRIRLDQEPDPTTGIEPTEEERPESQKKSRKISKDRKTRAGIFQYGIAAVGITLIILTFVLLISGVGSFSAKTLSYTLKRSSEITLSDSSQIWVKDEMIIIADCNSITAYNGQKSQLWNYNCELSSPRLSCNDQFALLYDGAGTEYVLLNKSGVQYSRSSDGLVPILKASVNAGGYIAMICGTEDSQQLQVFSPEGELLLRRTTKPDTSGALLDVLITDDGKNLVTLSLQYSDSSTGSQVTIYNLNQSGSGISDAVNSNFVAEDTLLFTLIPMNKGIAVLGDNRIVGYASGNTWKENWNERLTNRIVRVSASKEAIALTYGNELTPVSSGLDGKTGIYSYGGDTISSPREGITYFQLEDSFRVSQLDGVYSCSNSKGKCFWTYTTEEEIEKVFQCGEQWLLQTSDSLMIMNTSVVDS